MNNSKVKIASIFISVLVLASIIFSVTAIAIESPYVIAKLQPSDFNYVYSPTVGGDYKMFALRVGTHSERAVCIKADYSYGYAWSTDKSIYVDPGHSIDNQSTSVFHDCLWRLRLHTFAFLTGGSATGYMWYK